MADIVAKAGARTTFSMTLLTIAAVVALALGLMGLYGVMAFLVSQRTREFGIRMALGADCGSVSRMVLAQSFRLAFAGLLFGMAGTLAMARLFRSMLYDVGSTDPLTLTTVSALLLCTSLAASYAPARRAARVDPLVALAEL
jgi:ABC-type antimicrobial peptide transport system permease subunit